MTANNFDDDDTQSFVPLTAGTKVSHYKIISKIGAGGMGEVYLAQDSQLDRKVALKFLPFHLSQNEASRARFTREAKAAAKLDHLEAGRPHDAAEILEKVIDRYDDNRSEGAGFSVTNHYWLGQAYEESGRPADAIAQYETFLDIWKNADEGLKSVEDAKERLAKLKS